MRSKKFEHVSNNGYERKSKRRRFGKMYRKLNLTKQRKNIESLGNEYIFSDNLFKSAQKK